MPHYCTSCKIFSKQDDDPNCPTRKACNFVKSAMVHFIHTEGIGVVDGVGTKTVVESGNEFTVPADLKRCCASQVGSAITTPVFFAVTCVDCIEFFKALKPELFEPSKE